MYAVGSVTNESGSLSGSTIRCEYSDTRIVESIASHIKQNHCLHMHVYLDDWLFQHQDREIHLELAPEIVVFLQFLGREVNLEKSSLTPSQSFKYLGLCFCMDLKVVGPADHPLDKLHQDLHILMRKILVTPREFAVLPRTDQFLCTISRSGKITQATDPALASLPLGSLSLLHRSAPAGNLQSTGSDQGIVWKRIWYPSVIHIKAVLSYHQDHTGA